MAPADRAEDRHAATVPFWEFRGFGLGHRSGEVEETLLQGVDLVVPAGRFYLFVGASGGGKSSLLRLCAGLVETREPAPRITGALFCLGQPLHRGMARPRLPVAAVLQEEGLLDELTPRQNVELALRAAGRSKKLAPALLSQVGLDPVPERTALLSGGMRKRLAVARALAAEPEVLLCDEPTAGLDRDAARQIAGLLRSSHDWDPGRTTVVITHDLAAFAGTNDAVLVLDRAARTLRLDYSENALRAAAGAPVVPSPGEGDALHGIRSRLLAAASIGETVFESIVRLPPVEPLQVARTLARCTLEPAAFVAVAGAVIGGLSTFFALRNNPIQGGFESALLTGTGKVLTAVLVPLLTGFFFTARIAAGAAARLGTMKRNHQIEALQMMGIRPPDWLLTPLVWGMVVAMPVVTMAGTVASALASMAAARTVTGITPHGWAAAFFATVDLRDIELVAIKTGLSGYLVAIATYHLATGPKRSSAEVGEAVNASIVAGMALVLAVHAVLTFAAYA
jgi:D-methionine transport system ATP-binding protein